MGPSYGVGSLPLILLAGLITAIYVVPWIVAERRHVRNSGAVIVVDLLLGWTFIGWVVALAMAAGGGKETQSVESPIAGTSATTGMKACPQCAEEVKAAARVCRYCGHEFPDAGPAS